MTRRGQKWEHATAVIDVTDASRLLDSAYTERQLRFQSLILRYLSQILHGCTNAYCTTPTCLSCNKRLLSRPHRPPTQLTARALAFYLATQEDPHRALCPHQLKVAPSNVTPPYFESSVLPDQRQPKIDPKSLGQNLYNTSAALGACYIPWPNPVALFADLRAGRPPGLQHEHKDQKKPSGAATGRSSSQPINSPSNQRQPLRENSTYITSKILSNGEQIHKISHVLDSSYDSVPEVPGQEQRTRKIKSKFGVIQSHTKPKPMTPKLIDSDGIETDEPTLDKENRIALPVTSHLTCDILDKLIHQVQMCRMPPPSNVDFFVEQDNAHLYFQIDTPFVRRSIFYGLSDPETLLKSFKDVYNPEYSHSPLPHLDSFRLTATFRNWNGRDRGLIHYTLCTAVDALFRPPPELDMQKRPHLKSSNRHSSEPSLPARYLSDEEAAHVVMICIHALVSFQQTGRPSGWNQVRYVRSWGFVFSPPIRQRDYLNGASDRIALADELEAGPALLLAEKLLRGIGTRMCFEHILVSLGHKEKARPSPLMTIIIKHLAIVERDWEARKAQHNFIYNPAVDPGWTITATFLEWLRTIIIKKFEGRAEVNKWSSVGTAIIILDMFHAHIEPLRLGGFPWNIPYLNARIDEYQETVDFLDWEERPNTLHIFQFPFLFEDAELAAYFRTINLRKMLDQVQAAGRMLQLERRFEPIFDDDDWVLMERRLHVTRDEFLSLKITRAEPLKSTLDYLWGRERRMLLKPLKVTIGDTEGELGFDQGGVTYEFFRLVLAEAFQPDSGLFTVDPQTSMIWFHTVPLEPMRSYQMLGVLFSLAVYNGITLPVTFPLAFYSYLLGPDHPHVDTSKPTTDFIRDGWPVLAASFDQLLTFGGDVEEVFMREYTFSYEAYDRTFNIDMRTGKEATLDTPLVTNANRVQFVEDYITYLTNTSVSPQLAAFRRGFWACLHPRSLHFFTPLSFRSLVEGSQSISAAELRRCARYESPYHAGHPTIVDFWGIVEGYSQDELKRLLEFVSANDRVPITGYDSMTFVIERGGEDSEALPTSSTCFGKLYLREYGSKEKMKRKLEIALRYAKGFGIV